MNLEPGGGHEQRHLVATGLILAGAAVVLQTCLYVLNVYGLNRAVDLFDLEEGGLVTWVTSSTTFSAAVLVLILGLIDPARKHRTTALAAGLAFISFDDAVFLHERIASRIAAELDVSDSYIQVIWPLLYLPLLATIAVLLLGLARNTRPAHRLVVAGLAILAGAVALEVASHALSRADVESDSWLWVLEISLEEGAELVGWVLIAIGAAIRLVAVAETPGGALTPR